MGLPTNICWATYARISGKAWERFDAEQAARTAATVATASEPGPA